MRRIGKAFRRPPTGRGGDRNGGLPRQWAGVARGFRCAASLRRTLLAENLGKPSLWVIITTPWYKHSGALALAQGFAPIGIMMLLGLAGVGHELLQGCRKIALPEGAHLDLIILNAL